MKNRIPYLDGIRIISSIVVCIAHAAQIFILPKLGLNHPVAFLYSYAASFAVVVFFILSGFMVTNSIFNNKEKNGYFDSFKYWKDRLFRLYPPLIFAILLCILIYYTMMFFKLHGAVSYRLPGDLELARESIQYSANEIFTSLFFLQGIKNTAMYMNGPLWSLGDEFFIYFIASFVSILLMNKKKIIPILVILVFFAILYKTGHWKTAIYLYLMWGLGAVLSIEKRKWHGLINKRLTQIIFLVVSLLFFITFALLNFKLPSLNYAFSPFSAFQALLILIVILGFRSFSVIGQQSIVKAIEKITPQKDFTYTLYIIHFPILLFFFSVLHIWLNSHTLIYTLLALLFLLPVIIFISKILAFYLEDKKRISKLYQFFLDN